MDGVATVGFDLSFVDSILCMEAIPQRAAWDQLISRAYRMGADVARPIKVITLAYEDSLEEHIVPDFASEILPTASRVMGKSIARGLPFRDEDECTPRAKRVCPQLPAVALKPRARRPLLPDSQ